MCGVIATEVIDAQDDKGRSSSLKGGFRLKMLDRKLSIMYPEERLGGYINSASAQWQVIDGLFQGMRDVMSSGTAYTSGTFSIASVRNFGRYTLSNVVCNITTVFVYHHSVLYSLAI